ncbi:hypothetical protein LBMAG42_09620 [Deltaproteobacteria bacterium]|nr:hypothetical protein LBMAG42_09620 [Deltaproteobacteria bacterium]
MRVPVLLPLFLLACTDYNLTRPSEVEAQDPDPEEEDTAAPPGDDPEIQVTPSAVDFGNVLKDCDGQPVDVTITNKGKGKLKVRDIALSGDAASKFEETGDPVELALNEEYTFKVKFSPTAYVSYDVSLDIQSNDADEETTTVPVVGTGTSGGIYEESFEQTYNEDPIDVLWVLDNSGSMDESLKRLNDQLDIFINAFLTLGLDYHIGVVTTDMDNASQSGKLQGTPTYLTNSTANAVALFQQRASVGSGGSGDEKGLAAAEAALTDPLASGTNAGFLRTDSTISIIVLSDENDSSSRTAKSFSTWLEGLRADPDMTSFNAIVGDSGLGCTDGDIWSGDFIEAMGGDVYIDAATYTGGFFASICTPDFSTIVANMARSSAGMKSTFELTETPSDVSRIEVFVDGRTVQSDGLDGYTYEAAENTISFHGTAFPEGGSIIEVEYPVDEGCN